MAEHRSWALFSLACGLLAFGAAGSLIYQLACGEIHGWGWAALAAVGIGVGLVHISFTATRMLWIISGEEGR